MWGEQEKNMEEAFINLNFLEENKTDQENVFKPPVLEYY